MRHNQRPPLIASQLPPNLLSLHAGEQPSMVCPDCSCWQLMYGTKISLLAAHRKADKHTRCPGSGQRLVPDLTPEQWHVRLREAEADAGRRRTRRVHGTAQPPTPPPICRMRAA